MERIWGIVQYKKDSNIYNIQVTQQGLDNLYRYKDYEFIRVENEAQVKIGEEIHCKINKRDEHNVISCTVEG